MPRKAKRKTVAGGPGQAPTTPVDSTYGEGERAIESQRRAPVPDYSSTAGAPGPDIPPSSNVSPTSRSAPADRLAAAMAAAQAMAPPTSSLTQPSQRPGEPITAGLNIGPGPGTEVLHSGDRAVRTLQMLAEVTADAGFAQLAEQAAQRNR